MRLLFKMDKKDYDKCTHSFVRNSARSIMIKGKKIAMIHSIKFDLSGTATTIGKSLRIKRPPLKWRIKRPPSNSKRL